MKGLKKFNLNSLLGKIKLVPSMISGMSGKAKSTLIKAGLGVGMTGAIIAGTAINLNQNTDAVIPSTQDQDANSNDDSATSGELTDADKTDDAGSLDISFLSDDLKITDLDMSSILGERVAREVAAAAEGMEPVAGIGVDESGKPLTQEEINHVDTKIEGNYFIAPDGTPWVSEEEYNRYIAGQNGQQEEVITTDPTTTTGDSYYIAPDGSFWESEAAYQEYINGLTNTPEVTPAPGTGQGGENNNGGNDGSSYRAPDGSYWDSEADYLEYIGQGQNNNNNDNYYVAPDGSYWDSEADYNNYIKGFSESVGGDDNTNEDNNSDDNVNSGYFAPDGSYWASEQDYIDYINSLNNNNNTNNNTNDNNNTNNNTNNNANNNNNTNNNTSDNNNTNENTSSDYFVAPDGSVWASEQDYNDYMKSLTNDGEKTM